jgi:para-aminobenzoate synthetase component I
MKPHVREILYLEPASLAARLRGEKNLTLLESVMRHEHLGRYSYLACNPSATLRNASLDDIRRMLQAGAQENVVGLPPFQGGLAGYISYEFGRTLEAHSKVLEFFPLCPDMILHVYDTVISFDHLQEKAWIVSKTEAAADVLEKLLKRKVGTYGSAVIQNWKSNFTRDAYESAVQKLSIIF